MKALRLVSFRNKPFYVSDFDLNFFVWSDIEIFVFQKIKFWDQFFLTNKISYKKLHLKNHVFTQFTP